jgi:putative transposase
VFTHGSIQEEAYVLACQHPIERNGVKVGIVAHSAEYRWSSYRATNGNFALGSKRFAAQVPAALGRRAAPSKPARPRKIVEPESSSLFLDQQKTTVCPLFLITDM